MILGDPDLPASWRRCIRCFTQAKAKSSAQFLLLRKILHSKRCTTIHRAVQSCRKLAVAAGGAATDDSSDVGQSSSCL